MTEVHTAPRSVESALTEFRETFARIAEGAARRERERDLPFAEVQALFDAGFGAVRVPRSNGGLGLSLVEFFDLLIELGEADSNIPQIVRGHFTTVEILRNLDDGPVRDHWFEKIVAGAVFGNAQSEPTASGTFEISTTVTDLDGESVVSGEKYYTTGTLYADYVRVSVVDEDGDRRFVVVDATASGVHKLDDWDGIGQRLTASGTTHFDKAPVAVFGEFGYRPGFLDQQASFVQIVHLATLAGINRNLREDAVALVRSRTRTSLHAQSDRAETDYAIQSVVGRIATHALVSGTLVAALARELDEANAQFASGVDTADRYVQVYIDTSQAQIAIIDAVLDSANLIFNAGGSSTVREPGNLDRHWRNARTLASHNPVIYKPAVIGDYLINGTKPKSFLDRYGRKDV
ncbi:alkylation response protein AidB-like acyl-CoA dehydrogenase [Rhodococcus sp. 27YEA15]|uniref:acyl-CoA dehydrogenase family protein n=1 Tax=Rhodococcus sp. 27YEA15 TaxID=3156259 RepID=UPI003C7D8F71